MIIDSKVKIYAICIRPMKSYAIGTHAETTKTGNILTIYRMKNRGTKRGVILKTSETAKNIKTSKY